MTPVSLLYAVSGFVALGYQVVWFRLFVDRFGSTNLTFVLVVTNFIGGLGVGALASERVTGAIARRLRLSNPVATCGAVEVLVAASLLLTAAFQLADVRIGGEFPYCATPAGIHEQGRALAAAKGAVAVLCVFVPCFFMGMTFPLLCSAFPGSARFPSALYGWNTLGACGGILACEFVFLPGIGHTRTLLVLVGANVALAAALLALGARMGRTASGGDPRAERAAPAAAEPIESSARAASPTSLLLALAVLSGFVSGALESDMFRRVRFVGANSDVAMAFVSFWAILAIFLGAWTVRALPRARLPLVKGAFAAALVLYAAAWRFAYPIRDRLNARYVRSVLASLSPEEAGSAATLAIFPLHGNLPLLLAFVGIIVFPAYYLISWLLPVVCNRLHGDRRHLGVAYGANTLAFCVGLVGFGWIAPRVNVFYAAKLSMLVFAAAVFLLATLREDARPRPAWFAAAALALAAAALLAPRGFDQAFFGRTSPAALYPIRAMKSDGAHTTFVVDDPVGARLFFDGHSMSGTSESDQRYMRLMAHVPLLAQPAPRSALLICFGVGNTASAIAAHEGIEAIDVVDLNAKVFETAPEFAATNGRVHEDPRVTLVHDDGRNFLNVTSRLYDLVTSEPPPPMSEGVYRLYSREYYEAVLARLAPGGLMTQWLPMHQMPREGVERAIATFLRVFPHALAFVGHGEHVILVGGRAPIDVATIERRLGESGRVAAELARLGAADPVALLARIVASDAMLRRAYSGARVVSDERNDLAHLVMSPLDAAVMRYDPVALLADLAGLGAGRLACAERFAATLTNLALLKSVVPDFPVASLASVRATDGAAAGRVAFADADWGAIAALNEEAVRAARAGRLPEALALLERSLAMAGDQLHVLSGIATLEGETGDHEAALAAWRRREALAPGDPEAAAGIARELAALGR